MLLLLDKQLTDPHLLKPPSGNKSWSVRWNLLSEVLMGLSDTVNVWPDCAVPSLFFFVWHYQSSCFSLFLRHLVYLPICGSVKKKNPTSFLEDIRSTTDLQPSPASWSKWTDDIATSWNCCHKEGEEEVDWCQTVPQKSLRQREVSCLRYALTPQWWR